MHLSDDILELDRRESTRATVNSTITLRPVGGVNHEVALHDLSVTGCRVEVVETPDLGERLIARFPQLEPLIGELRWADGATAGLHFTTRIHPAVFYDLLIRLS